MIDHHLGCGLLAGLPQSALSPLQKEHLIDHPSVVGLVMPPHVSRLPNIIDNMVGSCLIHEIISANLCSLMRRSAEHAHYIAV